MSFKTVFYLHSVCYWINVQMTTIVSNIGQCWSWKLWEKYIVIALFEASNVRPKAFLAIKWNGPGRTRSSAVEINPKANLQKCFQLGCSTKGIQYSMFRWQLVELNCACHFTKLKSLAGQTKFPCFIYLYCPAKRPFVENCDKYCVGSVQVKRRSASWLLPFLSIWHQQWQRHRK